MSDGMLKSYTDLPQGTVTTMQTGSTLILALSQGFILALQVARLIPTSSLQ